MTGPAGSPLHIPLLKLLVEMVHFYKMGRTCFLFSDELVNTRHASVASAEHSFLSVATKVTFSVKC